MNALQPPLGASKDALDTPALCLDLDKFQANAEAVAAFCRQNQVDWRPHSKCHKSPEIARRLVEAGAIGMTCAKLGEAEVFGQAGIRDLLIANMVVGPLKVQRLVELRKIADPIVCVDHADQLLPIARAMEAAGLSVRVILEVDIGLGRVGVAPGAAALALARLVHETPGVTMAGIMGYEGHLLTIQDQEEKRQKIRDALNLLGQVHDQLVAEGIPCPLVSCGGTGSYVYSVPHESITEVQAGGAIFMDEFYWHKCQVRDLQFALTVVVTVVSRPRPDSAVIDAGRKTLNADHQDARVLGRPGLAVTRLSAEHGELSVAPGEELKIGDRLEIVPGYSDLTTVLHNHFYVFRGDRLEAIWTLEGRGRLA